MARGLLSACSAQAWAWVFALFFVAAILGQTANNVTQDIIDNIQRSGTRSTGAANYTAVSHSIATSSLKDDGKALGSTIFAVADDIGTPLGWTAGPLLAQAISNASVSKPVQLQAYGQAIALASNKNLSVLNNNFASPEQRASNIAQVAEGFNSGFNDNFDKAIITAAAQPQVNQGVFTLEQILAQAKASGASAVNMAWGLYLLGGPSAESSIFNLTSPFGAANSVFGARTQSLKQAAGDPNQIAQLLQVTAALASTSQGGTHNAEVNHSIKDSTHDKAVIQSVAQAVQQANVPSENLSSALATAISNALTQGGELPASYDPEVTAILIALAQELNQSAAITTGLNQARSAGFDFAQNRYQVICGVVNNTKIINSAAGSYATLASGAKC